MFLVNLIFPDRSLHLLYQIYSPVLTSKFIASPFSSCVSCLNYDIHSLPSHLSQNLDIAIFATSVLFVSTDHKLLSILSNNILVLFFQFPSLSLRCLLFGLLQDPLNANFKVISFINTFIMNNFKHESREKCIMIPHSI